MLRTAALIALMILGVPALAWSQAEFTLSAASPESVYDTVTGSGSVEVTVRIAQTGPPAATSGFSFALTHDSAVLTLDSVDFASTFAAQNGDTGPEIQIVDLDPVGGEGVTVDVLYTIRGDITVVFAETPAAVALLTYTPDSALLIDNFDGLTTPVDFSETLGDPAIPNQVLEGPNILAALTENVVVNLVPVATRGWTFAIPTVEAGFDPDSGTGGATVPISIAENPDNVGYPTDTQALQVAVSYDDTILQLNDVVAVGLLADVRDGDGPEFFATDLSEEDGFVVGAVYSYGLDAPIAFEFEEVILEADFDTIPISFLAQEGPIFVSMEFAEIGTPPIVSAVAVDEELQPVNVVDGGINFTVVIGDFRRGDMDGNGVVFPILDALFLLEFGFLAGPAPPCFDAADVDDNGIVFPILDALFILEFGFTDGPEPPAPGPDACGGDPTLDSLDCVTNPGC